MNHHGLLWNMYCVATVVIRESLNFKSAVLRSKISSFYFRDEAAIVSNKASHQSQCVCIRCKHYMQIICRVYNLDRGYHSFATKKKNRNPLGPRVVQGKISPNRYKVNSSKEAFARHARGKKSVRVLSPVTR